MSDNSPPTNESNTMMDRDEQVILSLLDTIEKNPEITQKDLSMRLGVAVGLVNSYLKRVIYKGYVKTKQLERRRLKYLLTPKGIREKSRLTYEFLEYSFQYIRKVRQQVHEIMLPYVRQGKTRVVFWGSGEVAELAYIASRELGLDLIAVVDPERAGKYCVDHKVLDIDGLNGHDQAHVLLVLAKPPKDQETKRQIEEFAENHSLDCVYAM